MRRYNKSMNRLKSSIRLAQKKSMSTGLQDASTAFGSSPLMSEDSTADPNTDDDDEFANDGIPLHNIPEGAHPTVESLILNMDIDEIDSEDDESLKLPSLEQIKEDDEEYEKSKNGSVERMDSMNSDHSTSWAKSVRAFEKPPSMVEDWDDDDDVPKWPKQVSIQSHLLKEGQKRYALGIMKKPWQKRWCCVGDGWICWHKKKDADEPSGRLRLVYYKCSEPVKLRRNLMSGRTKGYMFSLVPDNFERRELRLIAPSKDLAKRWVKAISQEIERMFREANIPRVRLNSGYEDISPSRTFKTESEAHMAIKEKYRSRIGGKDGDGSQVELGRGQFARVWLVERIKDQKLFACKNFILNDIVTAGSLERKNKKDKNSSGGNMDRMNVLDEIEILKKLDHPNIVKLLDVYIVEKTCVFMFLGYCDGGTLENLIDKSPGGFLAEPHVIAITRELLSAVWYIHSKGICHRDIKLENILLRKRKDAKFPFSVVLADFGISKLGLKSTDLMSLKCGSLLFTAPEVFRGTFYTNTCDVWAIGVTVHWMLAGNAPFGHVVTQSTTKSDRAIEDAVKKEILSGVLKENAIFRRVSDKAKAFVRSLLLVNPSKRPTADMALQDEWLAIAGLKPEVPATLLQPLLMSVHRLCHSNLLKQAALIVIAHRVDLTQMSDAHTLFKLMDIDGSGRVELDEFVHVFVRCGIPKEIAVESFKVIDLDNSGCLRFSEFAAFYIETKVFDDDMLRDVFNVLDGGSKGYITVSDIDRMLDVDAPDRENTSRDQDTVEERITFEQFIRIMKQDDSKRASTRRRKSVGVTPSTRKTSSASPTSPKSSTQDKETTKSATDAARSGDRKQGLSSFATAVERSREILRKTRKQNNARSRFRVRVRAIQFAKRLSASVTKKKGS